MNPPRRRWLRCAVAGALSFLAAGQVIEFESGGRRYQAQTKNGVTIMFATLAPKVRNWSVLQVAVTNGSLVPWVVQPDDFRFRKEDGAVLKPVPPRAVVSSLLEKASRGDVVKLVNSYESAIYGITAHKSTNGYEQRRQSAMAEGASGRLKAAATASAIAFVQTKLLPGQATDGALFYLNEGQPLGAGKLIINAAGESFEFDNYVRTQP